MTMIHPLLSPRLFFRAQAHDPSERALPKPSPRRGSGLIGAFVFRGLRAIYLRWGAPAGFVIGLALAFWALLPNVGG